MNQKAKPHKQSLVIEDQNDKRLLGLCFFVSEEFEYNDQMLIALYYGKISKMINTKILTSIPIPIVLEMIFPIAVPIPIVLEFFFPIVFPIPVFNQSYYQYLIQ